MRALVLACHPGPTIAVTAVAGILAVSARYPPALLVLLCAAVLAGQLSIGWSNDWLDSARDAAVQRRDKPTVTGAIRPRSLAVAAVIAAAAAVPFSFALGLWAGVAHLTGVAAGWLYNRPLKGSALSVLPYLVFFGLLPLVVTLGAPQPSIAAWWAMAAGALLGAGAHFANVLPDLEYDRSTGIRGLPHRLGAHASAVVAFTMLVVSAAVLAWGSGGTAAAWIGVGIAVLIGVAGVLLALRRPPGRALMRLVMLSALIDVILLAFSGLHP